MRIAGARRPDWELGTPAGRTRRAMAVAAVFGVLSLGCESLDRFDTGRRGAYCGSIIDASFARAGFAQRTRLQLQLDVDALRSFPGRITTDDGADGPCSPARTFDDALLRSPQKLEADPLSFLSFGEAREYNGLAWVDSTCDGTYLAVFSLMRNDDVELRLLRGETGEGGDEVGPFGVFQLSRFSRECGYDQD